MSAFRTVPLGLAAGLVLPIDLRRNKKLMLGLYEIEISRHVRRFARRGYKTFDVGGQSGYYALTFARLTDSNVISFDCDPDSCTEMEMAFAHNRALGRRISVICKYVGEQSSATDVSLDDIAFSQRGFVPDVVKMDIEGAEYRALLGARRILRERRPHLIIETHSPEVDAECRRLLVGVGYTPTVVEPRRWLPDYRPTPFNRWLIAEGHW